MNGLRDQDSCTVLNPFGNGAAQIIVPTDTMIGKQLELKLIQWVSTSTMTCLAIWAT